MEVKIFNSADEIASAASEMFVKIIYFPALINLLMNVSLIIFD